MNEEMREFMTEERALLMADLACLKGVKVQRRLNEFTRRVRKAWGHCLVIKTLKKEVPWTYQTHWAQTTIEKLEDTWKKIAQTEGILLEDLPDVVKYKAVFKNGDVDILSLPSVDKEEETLKKVLNDEVPRIMKYFRESIEGSIGDVPAKPMRGWVLKQGPRGMFGGAGSFIKTFMALEDGNWSWYDKSPDADATAQKQGGLSLQGVMTRVLDGGTQPFSFLLEGKDFQEPVVLAAQNADDHNVWVKQFRAHSRLLDPT